VEQPALPPETVRPPDVVRGTVTDRVSAREYASNSGEIAMPDSSDTPTGAEIKWVRKSVMLPPLVSPDLDLRDFRWMKLDIVALLNSDFNATADDTAWRAGVTLWCRAWHQVPAGSLPKDDATLCNLAGLGRDLKTWKRIKPVALHGFQECTDGRLYHLLLCNMASNAATEKHRYEDRKERDRLRKKNGSTEGNPPDIPPNSRGIPAEGMGNSSGNGVNSSGIPRRNAVEGEGEEKESKPPYTPPPQNSASPADGKKLPDAPGFEAFWAAYPRKVAKHAARQAYVRALRAASAVVISAGLQRQRWPDKNYVPHPATWLNQRRWTDDPAEVSPPPSARISNLLKLINGGAADLLDRARQQDAEDADRTLRPH
jgi:hypothetical protein